VRLVRLVGAWAGASGEAALQQAAYSIKVRRPARVRMHGSAASSGSSCAMLRCAHRHARYPPSAAVGFWAAECTANYATTLEEVMV
jgi:hypothetical protein